MKTAISAALLMLIIAAPTYAFQDPDKDKQKPPKQDEPRKQEPARQQPPPSERERPPQDKPQDKQPPRDNKQDQQQTDRSRQQDKQQNERQQQNDRQQQSDKDRAKQDRANQDRPAEDRTAQDQRARDERNRDNRDNQRSRDNVQQTERGHENRSARRIPEQDFHEHFGREHAFRVSRRDDRRFNYGGYWFVYNDPWPAAWSYDDDVYVDEIDGDYYLIDREHPGIRLYVVVGD